MSVDTAAEAAPSTPPEKPRARADVHPVVAKVDAAMMMTDTAIFLTVVFILL